MNREQSTQPRRNLFLVLPLSLSLLTACSYNSKTISPEKTSQSESKSLAVGKPYRIRGRAYQPIKPEKGFQQQGIASYYGRRFAGRPTASGEPFNPSSLTAAHKTLPLHSRVKVTNLRNQRSVSVVINDRGPFVKNRIIDLSKAAAQAIGLDGLAKVKIEYLGRDS